MAEAKKPAKKTTSKKAQAEIKLAEAVVATETTEIIKDMVETEAIAEAIVDAEAEIAAEENEGKLTKAGKRSAKGLKEAEQKAAKEERKAHASAIHEAEADAAKAKPAPKTRSRLERQGKKFRAASQLIDKSVEYGISDALELAIKTSPVKFDATVEMHVRLGVDPRHADQNIRASIVMPAGTGKKTVVAVFADADDITKAKSAGADIVGNEDFLQQIDKGTINFDILIATPTMMPKLGKYARTLGPKGLMPSPKSGTVTTDVAKAVSEAKAGRVEYRVDSTGIVHLGVGKVSFGATKLGDNVRAILTSIRSVKPASIKGNYILSIYITTSMGPSIKVSPSSI